MKAIDQIGRARKLLDEYDKCKLCNTKRNLAVLGYAGLYCKCEADRLCETDLVKEQHKLIKQILEGSNERAK